MRIHISLLVPVLATMLAAQAKDDPAAQLAAKEKAAKTAQALCDAADFARDNGLTTDWRRLLTRALAVDANHERANLAVGNVKHDGRWMSPLKAEILANTAKGLVSVNGVWVPEADAESARLGVFKFAGDIVSRAEFIALTAGQKRHPRTGELIGAEHLEQAKNNMFPTDAGTWVDEAEANQLHARTASPWIVRTKTCLVVSNMQLKDIEVQAQQYVDDAVTMAAGAFGASLAPGQRPVLMLTDSPERFRDIGAQIGGASSAYGGFLADGTINLPGIGVQRPAVALLDANWGAYYVKHAAGVAVAHTVGAGGLPAWMVSGVGSYAERFYSADIANWFGKQYLAAGGLTDLTGWFETFGISGDMDHGTMGRHLFQAGLLIAFCRHSGNDAARKSLDAVGAALASGETPAIQASIGALESLLERESTAIRAYLKTLTQG